jgi:cytochrome P450
MSEGSSDPLSLAHLREPAFLVNPYPLYARLREEDPVHWDSDANNVWVLTRHADVVASLRDPRFSAQRFMPSDEWIPEELRARLGRALYAVSRQLLFIDPPDHTRLRGLANRAFLPRVVEAMRPHIQEIVDALLDDVEPRGSMDVIGDFAFPLPVTVIAEMLGVPPSDREQLGKWTGDFGSLLDGGDLTFESLINALTGVAELMDYLRGVLQEHKSQPRDDLMQAFLAAEERGDTLSEDEVLANLVLLLAAGHGTTTHLLGNGLLALLRHPDQLAALRANEARIPAAVLELLRYDGPVQLTSRTVTEDLELDGKSIRQGQEVVMVLGAANHDPAVFDEPDELNIGRRMDGHVVAFGHGIHYCLGAPLARVEAEVAFPALLRRFPRLRLIDETPQWFPSAVFRGLDALPVEW